MTPGSESPSEETVRVLLAEKGRLLAFLEERVGSRADAEDLLQTAMLRVVTKGHAVRSRGRIIPWFYRVLQGKGGCYGGRRGKDVLLLLAELQGDVREGPGEVHQGLKKRGTT